MAVNEPAASTAAPPGGGSMRRSGGASLRRSVLLLAVLALLAALAYAWSRDSDVPNIDYYQYWVVAHALRTGEAGDIYGEGQRVQLAGQAWLEARAEARRLERETLRSQAADFRRYELGTYSTPWLYTTFAWWVGDDYDADQLRFQRASLVCLVLSVLALTWMLDYPALWSVLWLLFVVVGYGPALSEGRVGNVNRIQLGCLALGLLALHGQVSAPRWLVAGLVLSLGVVYKPSLAAVGLTLSIGWLLTRQLRKLLFVSLGAAAGAALALGLSSWYFQGPEAWLHWIREVPPLLAEFDHSLRKGNFSLVRVTRDALGWSSSTVFSLLFLGGLIAAARAGRLPATAAARTGPAPVARDEDAFALDFLMLGLGAVLPLLASDLAWLHYYVLALPLFVFVLRPRPAGRAPAPTWLRAVAAVALVMVAGAPLRPLLGTPGPLITGALAAGGALCLYALGLCELVRRGAGPGPAEVSAQP